MSAAALSREELKRQILSILAAYRRVRKGNQRLNVRADAELRFGDPAVMDWIEQRYEIERRRQTLPSFAVRETQLLLLRATALSMKQSKPLVDVLATWVDPT